MQPSFQDGGLRIYTQNKPPKSYYNFLKLFGEYLENLCEKDKGKAKSISIYGLENNVLLNGFSVSCDAMNSE